MHSTLFKLLTPLALSTACLSAQNQSGRLLFESFGQGFSRAGGYATSLAVVGDVNGDGFADIAVGDESFQSATANGTVELVSGLDGTALRSIVPAGGVSGIGALVAAAGDVNGDLVPDVLTVTRNEVLLFSGSDGAILTRFMVRPTALAGAGLWNGDPTPDFAWVTGGSAQVISGADGSNLATLGNAVTDVVAIPSTTPGVNGLATLGGGSVTLYAPSGSMVWNRTGYSTVASAGDVNGDGRCDVIANGATTADVLSGIDGSILLSVPGGPQAAGGADVNGDGFGDVAVGDSTGPGSVRAHSGANGSILFQRTGQEANAGLGFTLTAHPGAGASTRPAFVVGAIGKYNGSVDAGSVQVIAAATPGEFDGSFRPFGGLCNFMNTEIRIGRSLPTIGDTYAYRFDNAVQPMGFQFLLYGFSKTSFNGQSLPLTLPGTSGCDLLVSADSVIPGGLNVFQSITIPLNAGLVGVELHVQGINIFGFPILETSNGATMTIGN